MKLKIVLTVILLTAFMSIAGVGVWSYKKYQETNKELNQLKTLEGQQTLAETQRTLLLEAVGKLILLPEDEVPTIATITSVEELSEQQPFFKDATNGDKLLVYSESKRAIIYSPKKDTLVNVGALFLNDTVDPSTVDPSTTDTEDSSDAADNDDPGY